MLLLERVHLPATPLTTELLCLRCLCEVKSQYGNVYLWSGLDPLPPSFNQAAVLCLFAISVAFSYHTHRQSERGAHQCLSERRGMRLTRLWEVEKTHKVWCNVSICRRFKFEKLKISFNFYNILISCKGHSGSFLLLSFYNLMINLLTILTD